MTRLARIIPGVRAWIGAGQVDAYELAAREAFHSAVIQGSAEPLAPAGLAPATAHAAKPEPTASRTALAPPATAPFPPAPLAAAAQHAAPAIARAISAAAEPLAEGAAAYDSAEPPALPALPHRRQPRETAPDFLLRAPTTVHPVADAFFDSVTRQAELDR